MCLAHCSITTHLSDTTHKVFEPDCQLTDIPSSAHVVNQVVVGGGVYNMWSPKVYTPHHNHSSVM